MLRWWIRTEARQHGSPPSPRFFSETTSGGTGSLQKQSAAWQRGTHRHADRLLSAASDIRHGSDGTGNTSPVSSQAILYNASSALVREPLPVVSRTFVSAIHEQCWRCTLFPQHRHFVCVEDVIKASAQACKEKGINRRTASCLTVAAAVL